MCAQSTLVEETLQSQREDFHGSLVSVNGDWVRLISGEGQTSSEVGIVSKTILTPAADQQVEVEGALVVSSRLGEARVPMISRGERLPNGDLTIRFFDTSETLRLQIAGDTGALNIKIQYSDKPLAAALKSARFLEMLATTPGVLSFEVYQLVEDGVPIPSRMQILDLPLSIPEPELEEYRDRLRLLEGLYDIFVNTGVEIEYPANTEDEEGLSNFNFVVKAVRGGWVTLSVASFAAHVPAVHARALLEELRTEGDVCRAFYFDVPNENYLVFGREVDLGPSSRYLAAARLTSSEEEIEDQLCAKGESEATLDLTWEPLGNRPMHVFFDQWPKSSAESVRQDLRGYETIYGVSSQRFKQAWEQREPWTRDIPDGSRWISLIEADGELAAES